MHVREIDLLFNAAAGLSFVTSRNCLIHSFDSALVTNQPVTDGRDNQPS